MRFTQEVRSPYLSPRMVKAAMGLPRAQRTEKQALKALALKTGVPDRVVLRAKKPLKSHSVLEGGINHRKDVQRIFRHVYR